MARRWPVATRGLPRMSRDTSFYYSFLVLPPRKRRAIVAVWDFCRAVDDAVDEVAPEAHRRVADCRTRRAPAADVAGGLAGRAEGGRSRARPATPQGAALQPFVTRVQPAAAPVRGPDRRRGDGPLVSTAIPTSRRCCRILPPGRVLGWPDLRGDLRLPRPGRARLCRQPGHGAAADEHHSRRRGRSEAGPRVSAARRHACASR